MLEGDTKMANGKEKQTISAKDVGTVSADEILGKKSGGAPVGAAEWDAWEEVQVGFAPYWSPEENAFFVGYVVARDDRQPDFVRYLVQAYQDTKCQRGPVDGAEDVLVKKGEYFTVSVYHALAEPFDFMLANFTAKGDPAPLRMQALKKVKTSTVGQTCWTWKMTMPPDYKKKYLAMRDEERRALAADATERKALEAANVS